MSAQSEAAVQRPKFDRVTAYMIALDEAKDAYVTPEVLRRARLQLLINGVIIIAALLAMYTVGFLGAHFLDAPGWWYAVMTLIFPWGLAAASFNIMHDGSHGAFSARPWLNSLSAAWLDIMFGNSEHWHKKHIGGHHPHVNHDGEDDDIEQLPFLVLSPAQRDRDWRPWYQYQHLYGWLAYGMFTILWMLGGNRKDYKRGRVGQIKLPPLKGRRLRFYMFGKAVSALWAIVIPLAVFWGVPLLTSLNWKGFGYFWLVFVLLHVQLGIILALTFQLAHCFDLATFTTAADINPETGKMRKEYNQHQQEATQDFAPNSRFWNWFMGGLNNQVSHHLWPKLPHTLLPAVRKIVVRVSKLHNMPYFCQPTLWLAIKSHYRFLKAMGRRPEGNGLTIRGMVAMRLVYGRVWG